MNPIDGNPHTASNFYSNQGQTPSSDFIYDQTYKSYKIKQKFQKDPKFSYFNAVMQMKHKLSAKQQLYKNVFQTKQNQQQPEPRKTFYNKAHQSMLDPDTEVVKVQKLKRNSFRIVKQQPSIDSLAVMRKNQSLSEVASMNRTSTLPRRSGHHSNMSLYQKHNTTHLSFQMTTKARNNKNYVQLQVTHPSQIQTQPSFYQPSNPKPRLDEIMQEYRKMNRHSHYQRSKKSTLPKEFIERMYETNRLFYSMSNNNKKRTSLY